MFSGKFPNIHRPGTTFCLAILASLFVCVASAQQDAGRKVVFTCDFPGSTPSHYELSVASDGSASYSSQTKLNSTAGSDSATEASAASDSYSYKFTLSPSIVTHIFDLARRANYFTGDIDSRKKVASTGTKTLSYRSSAHNSQATYNYSTQAPVQELTATFQGLAETLEFARRLDYDLQYQKLALDEELKRMEDMASRGALEQLSVASPVL
jgi:hypothetical protein